MPKAPKSYDVKDVDLHEDAWPRFEALVKNAAKMGHKPHEAKAVSAKPARAKPRRRSE